MAERRKNKKKKNFDPKELEKPPTKEEYAIAKYLKANLPVKKTILLGHKVEYFIASKAVDCLLESPWAKNSKKEECHFQDRDAVVSYMCRMLAHKLFHRAKKIVVQKESKKKKDDESESTKEKDSKKSKSKSTNEKKESDKKEGDKKAEKKEGVVEKKKEKKKIKLDMHLEQIFVDSNEPYVWIYDPIPVKTWIMGSLMVVAAVLICLFPLWPQTIRHYIYYLSIAAAFLLVFIIGLAVFRLIFFVLVWIITFGKHHIWLFPNLTEDVGFFESFWPLYKYEYKGSKEEKKDKESPEDKNEKEEESQEKKEKSEASSSEQEQKEEPNLSGSEQESGDEKQRGENDFEIIEAEEAEESKSEGEDRKTR